MSTEAIAPFVRKLEAGGKLLSDDVAALMALPFSYRSVPAATYLAREGEPPQTCAFLLGGFAFRHKVTGSGGRAIVSIHVPGEAIDLQNLYLSCADHNVQTLTQADLAVVPLSSMRELVAHRPDLAKAVLTDMLVEASVLREWVTNNSRRDARTRLAHLLCEFAYRLDAQGFGCDTYELPMTQEQLGDALGLTPVHINRSIKSLERDGLINRNKRTLSFPSVAALREAGDFSFPVPAPRQAADADVTGPHEPAARGARDGALDRAHRLMELALAILDREGHPAAARLDHAVVDLGRRRAPPGAADGGG